MKKNDNINIIIKNYGCNAEGVAFFGGQPIFVPYSLINENVDAVVIKNNSKFCIAKILNIKEPNKERIIAPCPYFAKCGGCQLQHTTYQNSLRIKTQIVQNAITNIGKLDYIIPTLMACKNEYHYRNKIAMPINPITKKLGMYRLNSHSIVDIDKCILQKENINKLINVFNKFLSITKNTIYNEQTKKGLLKSLVAREIDNKVLITIVINGENMQDIDILIKMLSNELKNFGLSLNINKLKNNVILTEQFKQIYGLKEIGINEFGIKYSINNQSFLQVNQEIKSMMYQKIFEEIQNNIVIDAYSGAGLLSAMIAKHAKQVFGIEIIKEATIIADNLKQKNNITNLTNINGDCAVELPKLLNTLSNEEKENLTIVLDPPRKGCDKKVLDAIIKVKPTKIVYMSCDPSTLARDLNILQTNLNYKIKYIQPYDMFPQTKHIETLAVLEK